MPRQAICRAVIGGLMVWCAAASFAAAADFRIGLVSAGGRYAELSDDIASGVWLALSEMSNRASGRKIEILRADGSGKPSEATDVARSLLARGAEILVGPATPREIAALRDV